MPTYTYHCENCDHEFEKRQSFSEEPISICPKCKKKKLHKVYVPAMVMFKGSGYYVTDHKSSSSASNNGKKKPSSDNGKEETKSKDKAETKTEKKETKPKETTKSKV